MIWFRFPFPNPFNSSTTISYQLAQPGRCEITVLDITGREVARLVNEQREAGFYQTTWEAGSPSAGIYFLRLKASGETRIAKLAVVK